MELGLWDGITTHAYGSRDSLQGSGGALQHVGRIMELGVEQKLQNIYSVLEPWNKFCGSYVTL